MLTFENVKERAPACGEDLVGIASMDRFEGTPQQMDPRYIFPDARAMIVMGFRALRYAQADISSSGRAREERTVGGVCRKRASDRPTRDLSPIAPSFPGGEK